VATDGGVVTLNGEVGDETERAEALLLARTTEGVKRVEDGVVLLQGTVTTNSAKQRALTLARRTDGVTQVVDRIRIGRARK
jgi:osmotically-inducible protein OsmY